MAEAEPANEGPNIFDIIDLDDLFLEFDDNPFFNFDFDSIPESCAIPNPPVADEIDGVNKDGSDDFLSGVFVEGSDDIEKMVSETHTKARDDGEGKEEKAEDDDDLINKTLIRKMRNRESAIKSRERKKLYTKDLEMKSKYLESECHRLDYLLQCCMAENSVLRQSLQFQKERICGASMAKQESAVLFVESLPLVSLFWLISIACLLHPNLQYPNLKIIASREGRRDLSPNFSEIKSSPKIVEVISSSGVERLSRKYRGLRARMKQLIFIPSSCLWKALNQQHTIFCSLLV